MNAGELTVRVRAELDEFDAGMRQMEARAKAAGEVGANSIKSKFATIGSDIGSRAVQQLDKMSKSLLNPTMLAMNVADGFAQAIRTGNVAQAYVDMVNSLPIVSTFANLLTAIYDRVTGEVADDTRLGPSRDLDDIRRRGAERRRAEEEANAQKLANAEKARIEQIAGVRKNLTDLQYDRDIAAAKERGAEDTAISLERERKQRQITAERNALAEGASEEERQIIEQQFRLKSELIRAEERESLATLRERIASEEKAIKDRDDRVRNEKLAKDRDFTDRMLEQVGEEMIDLEEQRKRAQTAGVGEFQTALGSFKFDAYPASEKRQNDQKMVKYLEDLARRGLQLSEQRSSLGFT